MNLAQNGRLKQVTSDTLITGVNVGSQTNFCRIFGKRGRRKLHRAMYESARALM